MVLRIACIIDVKGWAWDRTSQELLYSSRDIKGDVLLAKDVVDKEIKMNDYDVILVYPWAARNLLQYLRSYAYKTIVCNCSEVHNNPESLKTFLKYTKHYRFIGANNENIRMLYQSAFPEKCVIVLSHGIDTEKFHPDYSKAPPIDQGLVIGWAGNGDRELKRLDKAKRIIDELNDRGVESVLRYASYGTKYQLALNKMPAFYRSCNAWLITSTHEAHPLVAYEALATGLPLVATKVGDLNDTILSGVNGVLLDVDQPEKDFADIFALLHNKPKMARRMGLVARQTILQRWCWENVLPQYQCLGDLLG